MIPLFSNTIRSSIFLSFSAMVSDNGPDNGNKSFITSIPSVEIILSSMGRVIGPSGSSILFRSKLINIYYATTYNMNGYKYLLAEGWVPIWTGTINHLCHSILTRYSNDRISIMVRLAKGDMRMWSSINLD